MFAETVKNEGYLIAIYMEKTGNLGWKIKWFALFRLESFRKHGL